MSKLEGWRANKRPNFLILGTDQLRYDCLGCDRANLGEWVNERPWPLTPHLDRLAAEGVRFTQAFTTCGLCAPTRASIMTGVYPHKHFVQTNYNVERSSQPLPPTARTWAHLLAKAGYQLGYVGKWHVNDDHPPTEFGFHEFDPGQRKGIIRPRHLSRRAHPHWEVVDVSPEDTGPYRRVGLAIKIIKRYANTGKPWVVRLELTEPHFPMLVPQSMVKRFTSSDIPPWPTFPDNDSDKPIAHQHVRRLWSIDGWTWRDWQPFVAAYFTVVELVDAALGQVLATLDEIGGREKTVVIFTADHGDMMGSHGMYDKGYNMFDDVYRIPLIVRAPGVSKPGYVCHAPVIHGVDLMPTILEFAQVELPDELDGRSLVPLLRGGTPSNWREEAVSEFHGMWGGLYSQRMVRTSKHKYIFNSMDRDELYDLTCDPHEMNNVINDSSYASVRADLRDRFRRWARLTEDQFNTPWGREAFEKSR